MKSNLDLIEECDCFPYNESGGRYRSQGSSQAKAVYWSLYLQGEKDPVGILLEWVVNRMPWDEQYWIIDKTSQSITSHPGSNGQRSHSQIFAETLAKARELDRFGVLRGWRDELYPVIGHQKANKHGISMERSGSGLFGINTYGVHMTAYVNSADGLKIWVPRRSYQKQTYGGMLDNSVAGGLAAGEKPFECLVREAEEEASLPEDLVRSRAKTCGIVSYFTIRDDKAGGESGLLQPECQFVYDMELPEDVQPKPNDSEVDSFYLWSVEEVKSALANDEFKPNCGLVLLDFFIRHSILTPENEPNYIEISSRLHRNLPFPSL